MKMRAPGRTNVRSGERIVTLIKAFLKVLKRNIPVCIVWYQGGEVRKIGSQNLAKWMENLDQSMLEKAMELDVESLINGDEPLVFGNDEDETFDKILATSLLQNDVVKTDLQRLPFPLTLMSKKEKTKYISEHIWQEHREKQQTLHVRLNYGNPECRPSFWPQEEWAWEKCNISFSKIKDSAYTGPGTFNDFLSTCVRKLFAMSGKDPETFVCQEQNEKTIQMKLRALAKGSKLHNNLTTPRRGVVNTSGFTGEDDKEMVDMSVDQNYGFETKQETIVQRHIIKEFELFEEEEELAYQRRVLEERVKVDIEDFEPTRHISDEGTDLATEDDAPMSITINSKGHEPIQITLNRLKRKRHYDS